MTTTCPCGHPITDTYLCGDCHVLTRDTLTRVPALVVDLELTMTRQRRFGDPVLGGAGDYGLPYNPAAAATLRELDRELARVVRLYRLTHTAPEPPRHPRAMAAWLLPRLGDVVALPWAVSLLDVVRVTERATRIIDAPAERTYAGPCDHCGTDLYATAGRGHVECHDCGLCYDLAARRAWLLGVVDDRLATAIEIARALTSLELPVTADRIYQWKHRDRLDVRGSDRRGRPLFRVGDVVDLLVAYAAKRGA